MKIENNSSVKSNASELVLNATATIVAAYVENNKVEVSNIPEVLKTVYGSLFHIFTNEQSSILLKPAVSIEESVHPDYIVCLEDGKKLKMLKRYIRSRYGLSVDEYRSRWGLPASYPVVAPNYGKKRSSLAKKSGLGVKKGKSKK